MTWFDRTVAVTGAAGFLGSHLCEHLAEEGASLVALDNFTNGNEAYLRDIDADIDIVDVDIRSMDADLLKGVDVIYHFAAIANPRKCDDDPDLAHDINVTGTKNVFAAAAEHSVDRVVFSSIGVSSGSP